MNRLPTIAAAVGLAAGLIAAYLVVPQAMAAQYGELPLVSPILVAWAVWLGTRYGTPGPVHIPQRTAVALAVSAMALVSLGLGVPYVAGLCVGPCVLFLLIDIKPRWATPRILFLCFLAPTSFVLDAAVGPQLQVGTAAAASWLTVPFDEVFRAHDQLFCGPHIIVVTPACSGARLVVRMMALAGVLCVLKPMPVRPTLQLFGCAFIFAYVANAGRIAALCVAAPDYSEGELSALDTYHDVSGLVAFVLAYIVLALIGRKLASTTRHGEGLLDADHQRSPARGVRAPELTLQWPLMLFVFRRLVVRQVRALPAR